MMLRSLPLLHDLLFASGTLYEELASTAGFDFGYKGNGSLEMAGMDFSFNLCRVNAIQKSSSAYLPGLDEVKVIEIWRGLRLCTPDGLPIINRSNDFSNLIIAAGHAVLGISLGSITRKLV